MNEMNEGMRKVELLAPARNADVGIEAFNHGADAVYIGAPAFSARAAAGNSVQDVERLARYGHQFGAKTIVALNTILTDAELPEAERLTWQLYEAGVDALIIQDLGLLQLDLPPIELHASTQTDNRTIEKTRLMRDLGMSRVVMARELSIEQIRAIHEAVPEVELECFVHGALCVCISGQCYMSAALTGRSANRGECAQPCRLPMDLLSAKGEELLARQKHLLSLRDMNRSAYIAQLIEAGVTSLKIEGRLKDVSYVKNVVAYYRRLIDALVSGFRSGALVSGCKSETALKPETLKLETLKPETLKPETLKPETLKPETLKPETLKPETLKPETLKPETLKPETLKPETLKPETPWSPASLGHCTYTFEPRLEKSFNRGFTSYFAEGEREPMWNFESPKARGERIGVVDKVMRDCFSIRLDDATTELHNGDGLAVGALGFRLNRYEPQSRTCFLLEGAKMCQQLQRGQVVWRNLDTAFEQQLAKPSAKRQLPVLISFEASAEVLTLRMCLEERPEVQVEVSQPGTYELAQKPQRENIGKQLAKLGDTVFCLGKLEVEGDDRFVPSSHLSELRRRACEELMERWQKVQTTLRTAYRAHDYATLAKGVDAQGVLPTDYLANVMNGKARETYASMGLENVSEAFELQKNKEGMVMQTRHCLKYAFGQCPRYVNPEPEKLLHTEVKLGNESVLKIGNKKFILKFGCKNDCISEIFTIFAPNLSKK